MTRAAVLAAALLAVSCGTSSGSKAPKAAPVVMARGGCRIVKSVGECGDEYRCRGSAVRSYMCRCFSTRCLCVAMSYRGLKTAKDLARMRPLAFSVGDPSFCKKQPIDRVLAIEKNIWKAGGR